MRPVASDKVLACQLCRNEFHREMMSSETNVFRKRMLVDRHRDGLRESCPSGINSLKHFSGAFLSGFLWPIILICLVQSPDLVYLRILECMPTHLLDMMDSTKEPYGYLASFSITLFLTSKGPFCAHVIGKVFWFHLLFEQGSTSSFNCLVFLS